MTSPSTQILRFTNRAAAFEVTVSQGRIYLEIEPWDRDYGIAFLALEDHDALKLANGLLEGWLTLTRDMERPPGGG